VKWEQVQLLLAAEDGGASAARSGGSMNAAWKDRPTRAWRSATAHPN